MLVGGDDEAVATGVCGESVDDGGAFVAGAGDEEAEVAFFFLFVAGEEGVGGGADA